MKREVAKFIHKFSKIELKNVSLNLGENKKSEIVAPPLVLLV